MKIWKLTALALMLALLCGCQAKSEPVPTEPAPTFGEPIVFETQPEGETQPDTQQAVLNDSFTSADGTVEFNFHIDQPLTGENLRILEAELRPITGEDAKRLAEVVFPDCTFYDREPETSKLYSKEEVEHNIELYTKYSDLGLLTELYGEEAREWSIHVADSREFWKKQLKRAKEENPHEICQWEFKPDSYYYDYDKRTPDNYKNEIYAMTQTDKAVYLVYALHSTRPDRQFQKLGIGIDGDFLPHRLGWYNLVHGDEPTEADVEAAKVRAQEILDELNVGRWKVSKARIVNAGNTDGAYIAVAADMLLGDVQIPNQFGPEEGYVLSNADISLTVDGEVVGFDLWMPMDLKGTVTDRPDLLPLEDILAQAKDKLAQRTAADQFGENTFPLHIEEQNAGEPLVCKVDISKMEYTMARMKAPDDAETFYYYPVLTFHGTANYYGKDSGTLHITTGEAPLFSLSTLNGELTVH